jgi:hypothetical protein
MFLFRRPLTAAIAGLATASLMVWINLLLA